MSEHKYRVGQAVEFFPERGVEHTAKGRFKIVRLLLGERNAPLYRIKHEVDGHERMVDESELGTRVNSADPEMTASVREIAPRAKPSHIRLKAEPTAS